MSEFARPVDPRHLPTAPLTLVADAAECAALAARFGLVSIEQLTATATLTHSDGNCIAAQGRVEAKVVQSCAVSGDDLKVAIREDFNLRFVPRQAAEAAEEIDLATDDLDEIEYAGHQIDLGEAVAQTLALAIDPYLEGPNADRARKAAGLAEPGASGPFAALAALKSKD